MTRQPVENPYRDLPSVERLLADERVASLAARHGHDALVEVARAVLEEYRAEVADSGRPPDRPVVDAVIERATSLERSLRAVINATGVVIHTNLGRAPLSEATLAAMAEAGRGYSNLEFDVEAGERGSRFTHLESLLRRVTGAEAAIAVNNNASALMLALAALARDREVVISRGQLVEIGGGFRIPDVMRESGAELVEVGTTNRTYLRDYAEAITKRTGALLRVHASNFRVVGFTEQPAIEGLASLARERGLLLIDDVGSGALIDPRHFGLGEEPLVQASVAAGADVVLFSGDKLLGGPQAGIAAGRRDAIAAMRRHPLSRALRMDKASIAGLAATLEHYARGEAVEQVPVWRMIAAPAAALRRRARRWARVAGEVRRGDRWALDDRRRLAARRGTGEPAVRDRARARRRRRLRRRAARRRPAGRGAYRARARAAGPAHRRSARGPRLGGGVAAGARRPRPRGPARGRCIRRRHRRRLRWTIRPSKPSSSRWCSSGSPATPRSRPAARRRSRCDR